jgi:glucosamine-6-phosphate deaminase
LLLRVLPDYQSLSRKAALIVAAAVQSDPRAVLGLPTGGSPAGMFAALCEMHAAYGLDFSGVRSFNLDEYVGVPGSDPRSFRGYMDKHFFPKVNLPKSAIGFLDGTVKDLDAECRRYDAAIEAAGGIDLIVLGIGTNGHIAFNEPAEAFSRGTNVIRLAPSTVDVCLKDFGTREAVPERAITMGVGTLLRCRRILLLANGPAKAQAVRDMVTGTVSPRCPATALQNHPAVEVLLDESAFALLAPELPAAGVQVVV